MEFIFKYGILEFKGHKLFSGSQHLTHKMNANMSVLHGENVLWVLIIYLPVNNF